MFLNRNNRFEVNYTMIYTVTLNPAIDCVLSLDELCLGAVNRAGKEALVIGGKGINVSIMLNNLNTKSRAMGFIAGFTGRALNDEVEQMGISTDFVTVKNGFTRVNIKLHAKDETEINGNGPDISEENLNELLEKLNVLESGDTVVLSGSVPKTVPQDFYAIIAKKAKSHDAHIVADASGELLRGVLPYNPLLIKPNRDELADFFGESMDSRDKVICAAEKLQRLGARNVIVSMAGDGAILYTEQGEIYTAPAAKGTVINSVGAGDSMLAGFLAARENGSGYAEALAMGTAAGGATAFSVGIAEHQKVMIVYESVKSEVHHVK